jgi:hypothetical protein
MAILHPALIAILLAALVKPKLALLENRNNLLPTRLYGTVP